MVVNFSSVWKYTRGVEFLFLGFFNVVYKNLFISCQVVYSYWGQIKRRITIYLILSLSFLCIPITILSIFLHIKKEVYGV